jgi:hypothetical protein
MRFSLMNVNEFTKRVLEITRLDCVFEIIPKGEPAIARIIPACTPVAACA